MVIKDRNVSYEGLQRKLKQKVTRDKVSHGENNKKTKAGDLLVEKENENIIEALKEEVMKHIGGAEVKLLKGNIAVVHIYDMDAVTTKEELVQAVEIQTGSGSVVIRPMRPMAESWQAATLEMAENLAKKIVKAQKIRVGWTSCRVKKRVDINRCFTCDSLR
ncbi:unnamed protein product [Psylliodes chrysocephalus]|uniref:Uncharacterized protein n=1 Tax=Psylliodes chrysocephalus TaxID=3402493 RepID=A0A9P0CYK6_9CUCU|nr:unnamed protein product [Psylliodes chrysocephala]